MKHCRFFLAAGLALAALPAFADQDELTLRSAFSDAFLVGAAVSRNQVLGHDPEAMKLAAKQFNTLTAENVMKWEKIEPLYTEEDALAALGNASRLVPGSVEFRASLGHAYAMAGKTERARQILEELEAT